MAGIVPIWHAFCHYGAIFETSQIWINSPNCLFISDLCWQDVFGTRVDIYGVMMKKKKRYNNKNMEVLL